MSLFKKKYKKILPDVPSPLLFTLFINDMPETVSSLINFQKQH